MNWFDYYKNTFKQEFADISLPMNSPVYQSDELGIYESSYSILINFLKNTPEIENVWLHGSRAIGTANSNSDIDMLVDSPNDSFEILKNKIKNIRMPYRIDIVNIHEASQADFIRQVTPYTKILYRKKDFVQA